MIAFIRNESGRPDDEVREIVEFALGQVGEIKHGKIAVWIKRGDRAQGRAGDARQHEVRKWQGRARYRITCNVPTDADPFGIFTKTWTTGHASTRPLAETRAAMYDRGERRYKRWPLYRTPTWQEQLVHLAAHEFAHILEYDRSRKGSSEVWCEEVAERALEAWRARPVGETHGATDALTNATADGMIATDGNATEPEEVPMTEDATVTLMAKPDAKTPWHFQATEGSGRAICGTVVNPTTGARLIERDCDPRTVRLLGRPVCSNCAAEFNNGNTTTEEVTMAASAPGASTEVQPDPKPNARTSSRSGTRSSSGPGRGHAAPTAAKATTPAKAKDAGVEIEDGIDKALIAQVKKALTKPELTSPPSGSYTIIRSDGFKVGGYRPLSRKGLCVMLPVSPSQVKQTVKGADVEPFEKNVYKSRVYVTTLAQVGQAVKLIAEHAKKTIAAAK